MANDTLRSKTKAFIKAELNSKPFIVSKADKQEYLRRMQRTFVTVANELSCEVSQDSL